MQLTAIFSNSADELQFGLDVLSEYCARWKLEVNVSKIKNLILRIGGRIPTDYIFIYEGEPLNI